jgi:cystatin-A/B
MQHQVGAFGQGRQLEADELELVLSLQQHIVSATPDFSTSTFEPVSVKSQVVAGMNYWVKIKVDGDEYIHVKIYKPLPYTNSPPTVQEVIRGKTLDDPLN